LLGVSRKVFGQLRLDALDTIQMVDLQIGCRATWSRACNSPASDRQICRSKTSMTWGVAAARSAACITFPARITKTSDPQETKRFECVFLVIPTNGPLTNTMGYRDSPGRPTEQKTHSRCGVVFIRYNDLRMKREVRRISKRSKSTNSSK
jgi:hypothetical protein